MKNLNKLICMIYYVMILVFLTIGCKKKPQGCPAFTIVPQSPYRDPIWHPSGSFIGFNHTPIKSIDYNYGYDCPMQATYNYVTESKGFWLINSDGTDQRQVLRHELQLPVWSPDGKWIAFVEGGQIFKMPFDGQQFDETKRVQLTYEGRNFFPAWSSDGKWLTYHQSLCSSTKSCGVWRYALNTNTEIFLYKLGLHPGWLNDAEIVFSTTAINDKGVKIGDTLLSYNLIENSKRTLAFVSTTSNGISQIKPHGDKIGFMFQDRFRNLFVMETSGKNPRQITTKGCEGFSWSPDGRIVYVEFDYQRIASDSGVLYTMNADGTDKKQLTKNQLNNP